MNKSVLILPVLLYWALSPLLVRGKSETIRYLLYDVNHGEGFNLRRDVYVRFANLVRFLNEREAARGTVWTLVLPPWGRMQHWRRHHHLPPVPWAEFFDIPSLNAFVPVVEFHEFLRLTDGAPVDRVYHLQSSPFNGTWSERVERADCEGGHPYRYSQSRAFWFGWMFGRSDLAIREFACLSVQAEAKTVVRFLLQEAPVNSVMLDRAEHVISGTYSEWSPEWWTGRRSQVFAAWLRGAAAEFRRSRLQSEDATDGTERPSDWRRLRRREGSALGGPYAAVHLRRGDFEFAHPDEVPTLPQVAQQLRRRLGGRSDIRRVFVASDESDPRQLEQLEQLLQPLQLVRFSSDNASLSDGHLAAIDQIVCSHARVFVGTRSSTFTLRIVEERSLLGFARETSVGVLCAEAADDCPNAAFWQPQFEPKFTRTDREEL